mmetsp:Transcript_22332/g.33892  ORF Transcript_22332/g.33892 Transcript_22332/m.33892 type:complete len:487 (-) Transcript_22332:384-1844(-)
MVFGLLRRVKDYSTQSSDYLLVTSVAKRPQAIVVIFGHIGTSFQQMKRYAELYHDRNCSTICATAPILSLAAHDESIIGDIATTACRETARLIRMGEMSEMGYGNVPIVVHVLGNGGCQLLEQMEKRIFETISKSDFEVLLKSGISSGVATPSLRTVSKSGSTRSLMATPTKSIKKLALKKKEFQKSENIDISSLRVNTEFTRKYHQMRRKSTNKNSSGPVPTSGCVGVAPGSIINLPIPPCTPELRGPDEYKLTASQSLSMADAQSIQEHRRLRRRRATPPVKRVDIERVSTNKLSTPRYNLDERAYKRDIEMFASRLTLGCIVFDSAPYFPSMEKETAAAGILLSSHAMKLIVQTAMVGSHGMRGLNHFNYLGYLPSDEDDDLPGLSGPNEFWKRMKNLRLSKRHAFIYSKADIICDPNGIKEIIDSHRESEIQIVAEKELDGSRHLAHCLWRSKDYTAFVGKVIDSLEGYKLGEEKMSDWFDD